MKKQIIIMALSTLVISVMAQPTNNVTRHPEYKKGDWSGRRGERGERKFTERYREMDPEKKAELKERQLQLMKKTLKEIGVSEEQGQQIAAMQQNHREAMKVVSMKVSEARKKLSELEKTGASEQVLYAAIDAVADAQAEQMKVLARNKIEMERILGPEKFRQFMEAARSQYRQHGRRGGHGMPPRPSLPPVPRGEGKGEKPPKPLPTDL